MRGVGKRCRRCDGTDYGKGCPKCGAKRRQRAKLSARDRGYTKLHEEQSKAMMQRGDLCQCPGAYPHRDPCSACGGACTKVATLLDHVKSLATWLKEFGTFDGADDPKNKRPSCGSCHNVKSIPERKENAGWWKGLL